MRVGVLALLLVLQSFRGLAQTVPPPVPPPVAPVAQSASGTRVGLALVIGNSRYNLAPLPSVDVDRHTMATALQTLGFKVREIENIQRPRDFEEELKSFLDEAVPEDTLIVYYSGHGLQIDGKAYLLGTGMPGAGDTNALLRDYSEDVDKVIRIMEDSAASARVLIVDACRNNAFATSTKKSEPALRRGYEDTFLLFADEPGKTVPARSETSVQSPFTAGLLFAFENSDKGLEERFQMASEKARLLSPGQNPRIYKSDASSGRNRPFLDHGGRLSPLGSAVKLLDEAEEFYNSRAWDSFRNKIGAARILATDPALTARLDDEMAFSDHVVAAAAAEADPKGAKWTDAAQSWQKAAALFPARAWALERAAVAWLLADRLTEAAGALGRLRAYEGTPWSKRASAMLTALSQADPSAEATAKSAASQNIPVLGPEFEKFPRKQA